MVHKTVHLPFVLGLLLLLSYRNPERVGDHVTNFLNPLPSVLSFTASRMPWHMPHLFIRVLGWGRALEEEIVQLAKDLDSAS